MIIANVQVNLSSAEITSYATIPKGAVGLKVRFQYADPLWNKLSKTAVFRNGTRTVNSILVDDCAAIPHELLGKTKDTIYVGLYGTDSNRALAIPTVWAKLGEVSSSATPSSHVASEATLPYWAQIQEKVDSLSQEMMVQEDLDRALLQAKESGAFDGPQGPKGPKGEQGDQGKAGPAGYSPVLGTDYWTTEERNTITAEAANLAANLLHHSYDINCTASGSLLSLNNTSKRKLHGFKLYGKTTQNSTPTPDAPVSLQALGDDWNVSVSVVGENLIALKDHRTVSDFITRETKNGVLKVVVVSEGGNLLTVLVSAFINASFVGTNNFPAGTYTYNGAARVVRSGISNNENTRVHLILADGTSTTIDHGTTKAIAQGFSVEKITFMSGTLDLRLNDTVTLLPILESGNSAIQTLTIQTPNGLPGIPVSSGGNYIDENGQMWICDEIDFARGNYVQRIGSTIYDGTSTWITHAASGGYLRFSNQELTSIIKNVADSNEIAKMRCSALSVKSANATYTLSEGISLETNGCISVYVADYAGDLDAWKDYLTRNPMHVIYALAKPIETDLTVEQITQYSALHTNYPNTTIYNDEGAGMEVKYVADTKNYIDKKFSELATAILNV